MLLQAGPCFGQRGVDSCTLTSHRQSKATEFVSGSIPHSCLTVADGENRAYFGDGEFLSAGNKRANFNCRIKSMVCK
jgi:hypothetical protein